MAPLYLSASKLEVYTGTFSFDSSQLDTNIKHAHPNYDIYKPETMPYIPLSTIERYYPYLGALELPSGVAYDRQIMKRNRAMHSAAERAESVKMNGSLHGRYPFNYDRYDKPKEKVGMSIEEYWNYVVNVKTMSTSTSHGNKVKKGYTGPCEKQECVENKQETAKLRGKLSEKEVELRAAHKDFKEYVTEKRNEIQNLEATVVRVLEDHTSLLQRAETAEHDYRILVESRKKKIERIRDLEEESAMLKGGGTEKRPREEPGEGAAGGGKASKKIKVEKGD